MLGFSIFCVCRVYYYLQLLYLSLAFILLVYAFQDEIKCFYAEKQITVQGREVATPVLSFEEACFPGKWL